jgi:hypothetical protein
MKGILGICRIFITLAGGMHQLLKWEVIFFARAHTHAWISFLQARRTPVRHLCKPSPFCANPKIADYPTWLATRRLGERE